MKEHTNKIFPIYWWLEECARNAECCLCFGNRLRPSLCWYASFVDFRGIPSINPRRFTQSQTGEPYYWVCASDSSPVIPGVWPGGIFSAAKYQQPEGMLLFIHRSQHWVIFISFCSTRMQTADDIQCASFNSLPPLFTRTYHSIALPEYESVNWKGWNGTEPQGVYLPRSKGRVHSYVDPLEPISVCVWCLLQDYIVVQWGKRLTQALPCSSSLSRAHPGENKRTRQLEMWRRVKHFKHPQRGL